MSKGALLKSLNTSVGVSIIIQAVLLLFIQSSNPFFYLQSFWLFTGLIFILQYLDDKGPKTIINYYPNGKILSKFIVINGLYEGNSWGWHENGNLAMKTTWKTGKPNGLTIIWDLNGKKISSDMFKDGLLHGKSIYYDDGATREEWSYKQNILHGWHRSYNGNKIAFEEYYINGKANGISIGYKYSGRVGMFFLIKDDKMKLSSGRILKDGELAERWAYIKKRLKTAGASDMDIWRLNAIKDYEQRRPLKKHKRASPEFEGEDIFEDWDNMVKINKPVRDEYIN